IVHGTSLESFHVDVAESGLIRGNIYRGTIANVQPSLNAAFVEYGGERHGFLSIQDVVEQAWYHKPAGATPRIEEVLDRGKPVVVQVAKDAVGQKGCSLTTNLSLAGRYLVLTPFEETRGVSRKVEDEDTRKKLRQQVAKLELPPGCGVIVRTNALDQTKATLSRDLAALLRLWKRVQTEATRGGGNRLLYNDQDLIVQALRDHLDSSIEEVLVDDDDAFDRARNYMQAFMPRGKTRLVRYEERLPLFSRFDVEPQIDRIHERRVELKSGGSIVIESTEALTAIDVNSGRSTRAATQEETALHTNLEAADEVARQLRLRDIGGLVVVDFIDMRASRNQRKLEKSLKEAMKDDKARSSVGRISPNGLLEINRQRIRQALAVRTHRSCPTCGGAGNIASPELVALNLLRRIEAKAATGTVAAVRIALHPELADAVQNGRRGDLAELEKEFDFKIEILATSGLHRAEERVEWSKRDKPLAIPPRPARPMRPVLNAADLLAIPDEDPEDDWEDEEPAEVSERSERSEPGVAAEGQGGRNKRGRGRKSRDGREGRDRRPEAGNRRGGQPDKTARPQQAAGGDRRGRQDRPVQSAQPVRPDRTDGAERPTAELGPDGLLDDHAIHDGEPREAHAEGSPESGERRSRKRRRGGRKRRKSANGAGNGVAGVMGEAAQAGGDYAGGSEGGEGYADDGQDFGSEPGDDFGNLVADGAAGDSGAGGADGEAARRKRRGRRRRGGKRPGGPESGLATDRAPDIGGEPSAPPPPPFVE
ncbi:MAG TPA: Rne/Rng family ribonuclease, partial [Thermoanaerobaculia bacterium]|nr:Rne/Rng family ribonuclease [Thermoanaerobaculia bacterium]